MQTSNILGTFIHLRAEARRHECGYEVYATRVASNK